MLKAEQDGGHGLVVRGSIAVTDCAVKKQPVNFLFQPPFAASRVLTAVLGWLLFGLLPAFPTLCSADSHKQPAEAVQARHVQGTQPGVGPSLCCPNLAAQRIYNPTASSSPRSPASCDPILRFGGEGGTWGAAGGDPGGADPGVLPLQMRHAAQVASALPPASLLPPGPDPVPFLPGAGDVRS